LPVAFTIRLDCVTRRINLHPYGCPSRRLPIEEWPTVL
jgi:hypothetical protein